MATLYNVAPCQGGDQIEVDEGSLTLNPGEVISFSSPTSGVICGTVGSSVRDPAPTSYTAIAVFTGCEDCNNDNNIFDYQSPRSAYTEQIICVQVCDDMSGSTVVVAVNPPHPVWTDNYGTEVIQLNAVTLGGVNGLNN
jgi:hypothetical protein